MKLAKKNAGKTEPHEYGPWLRASPYNPGKIPFVVVPGMGDGLGGVPSHAQRTKKAETAEMAGKSTKENAARFDSGKEKDADLRTGTNMESHNSREQITLTDRECSNQFTEVFTSNPNLTSFHTDIADFETQIQDIDSEISKFDNCETHVEKISVSASQAPPTREKYLAPSMQTQVALQQPHQVKENSPPANQGSKTLRTWKRLARDNPMETDSPLRPTAKKRSREEEVEYLPELPTKKSQVSKGESQKNSMAKAAQQSRQAQ